MLVAQLPGRDDKVGGGQQATGAQQIVAWIRPVTDSRSAGHLGPDTCREFLRGQLPQYMIPSHVEVLEEIPRLANGKIDKQTLRRLPRLSPRRTAKTAERGQAVSQLVEAMQSIWCQVLDADEVCEEHDFFELGGDSLTSINVVARASKQGIVMKPGDLFDFPRLGELCSYIAEEAIETQGRQTSGGDPALQSRNLEGSRRPLFMIHGGGRLLAQLRGICRRRAARSPACSPLGGGRIFLAMSALANWPRRLSACCWRYSQRALVHWGVLIWCGYSL